jgi:hypothetical protein
MRLAVQEQSRGHAHHSSPVGHAVMDPPYDRGAFALNRARHVHPPERPKPVERLDHQVGHQVPQVAVGRPRSDVPGQVEGRVVDPGRRGKPQRRRREPLLQPRRGAETRRNVPTNGVDVVPALDQEDLDRVTAHVARLQTEDAGVLAAQPLQVSGMPRLAQLATDSGSVRAAPQGLGLPRTGTALMASANLDLLRSLYAARERSVLDHCQRGARPANSTPRGRRRGDHGVVDQLTFRC